MHEFERLSNTCADMSSLSNDLRKNKPTAARHVSRRTCAAMTTKASTTNMHWNRDIVNIECDGIVCYVRRKEHRDR